MNYLNIFGKKVGKFQWPWGTLDYQPEIDSETGMTLDNSQVRSDGVVTGKQFEFPAVAPEDSSMSYLKSIKDLAAKAFENWKSGLNEDPKPEEVSDLSLLPGKSGFNEDAMGLAASIGTAGLDMVGKSVTAGKNFGAGNLALDAAGDALGELAGQFGPWGKVALLGIKGLLVASNTLGLTVLDLSVGGLSSGYGNIGLIGGLSFKVWLRGSAERMLAKNREKVQLALRAKAVSDELLFLLEARVSSVDNTIMNNQIALSGGINSSMLSAKKGGKLDRLSKYITKALYGAKLKKVEVSEEPNLLPEGELHKNKHDDFDLPVTKKGIPVITVENGAEVSTIIDLQENKDDILQHAEIERSEIIFSKELTDYIEEARKKWHDGDDSVLLEVGKRVTKELLLNTLDNTGLIRLLKENE